jgi:hypothetical protein
MGERGPRSSSSLGTMHSLRTEISRAASRNQILARLTADQQKWKMRPLRVFWGVWSTERPEPLRLPAAFLMVVARSCRMPDTSGRSGVRGMGIALSICLTVTPSVATFAPALSGTANADTFRMCTAYPSPGKVCISEGDAGHVKGTFQNTTALSVTTVRASVLRGAPAGLRGLGTHSGAPPRPSSGADLKLEHLAFLRRVVCGLAPQRVC